MENNRSKRKWYEVEEEEEEPTSMSSSSSSSSQCKKFRWDVFLSFRGEDTRHNFIDRLYKNLVENGISTFRDDGGLKKGEEIQSNLLRAIDKSEAFIVVMSKNYAYSKWCLFELDRIVDWGRLLLPVFYDVDPSDVRNRTGPFEEAFLMHEQRLGHNSYFVFRWKKAMAITGSIAGWDSRELDESQLIQSLVRRLIMTKLSINTPLGVANGIVSQFEKLFLNLKDSSNIVEFPHNMSGLRCLESFIHSGCSKLKALSDDLSCKKVIAELAICRLKRLERFCLNGCRSLNQQLQVHSLTEVCLDDSDFHEVLDSIVFSLKWRTFRLKKFRTFGWSYIVYPSPNNQLESLLEDIKAGGDVLPFESCSSNGHWWQFTESYLCEPRRKQGKSAARIAWEIDRSKKKNEEETARLERNNEIKFMKALKQLRNFDLSVMVVMDYTKAKKLLLRLIRLDKLNKFKDEDMKKFLILKERVLGKVRKIKFDQMFSFFSSGSSGLRVESL